MVTQTQIYTLGRQNYLDLRAAFQSLGWDTTGFPISFPERLRGTEEKVLTTSSHTSSVGIVTDRSMAQTASLLEQFLPHNLMVFLTDQRIIAWKPGSAEMAEVWYDDLTTWERPTMLTLEGWLMYSLTDRDGKTIQLYIQPAFRHRDQTAIALDGLFDGIVKRLI